MRMNTQLTELAFVLDRSGSMGSVADAAIEGFNDFLRAQQSAPGLARLTLALFDDEYLVPARSLPIAEVLPLDNESYVPRNSTALLDAIGRTVDELGARLAAMPERDRPGKVIVAILTDGLENASVHYTWRDIAGKIRLQRGAYQWEFLFLGANQDAIATAAQIHIAAENAATFRADKAGVKSSGGALSRKTWALRALHAQGQGGASAEVRHDAAAPMSDLLREEDRKNREQP
jgi:hypothetical protein